MAQNEMFNIDHLGIAVKSLSAAKLFYQKLGLTVVGEETSAKTPVKAKAKKKAAASGKKKLAAK